MQADPASAHMCAVTLRDWAVQPGYHRTVLRLGDGGTVGLDWFRWRECAARLLRAAPLLLVAHPITGGLPHMYRFFKYINYYILCTQRKDIRIMTFIFF